MVKNMLNKITMELKNRGYNAEITTVVKNGVEKKGITIGDGNIKPIIYPDLTKTLDECVDEIINTYENTPENFYDVSKITSWEYVKDNLMICLQKKSNEDILKRDFLDLEMYVRVDVSNGGTYKVKPNMFKDVSDDEVIARALFNTEKNTTINNMAMAGSDNFTSVDQDKYDMFIGFSFNGKRWTYGLRSTKVNCSEIAMKYGGGGHPGAAGFSSDDLLLKSVEE